MTKKAKLSNGTRRIRNKNWSDTNARQKIHESFAFTFTFNVQRIVVALLRRYAVTEPVVRRFVAGAAATEL